ncbi:MAG: trimethylamine methyltransferase family protein [Desulfosarcinaceae bacterium]|jgi:trimethylamine--corrinoid protein Co-methyltransferase
MSLNISMDEIPSSSLEKIHDSSLQILAETGVVFHSQAALDLFKRRGATVSGKTVFISEKMVDKALETAPSRFEWTARDPIRSVVVGKGFLVQPPVGAIFVRDTESGRRRAQLEDYTNIIKLCQGGAATALNGSIPVDPSDVPGDRKHLYMMREILRHTDKPIIGICTDAAKVAQTFDMVSMVMGGAGVFEESHVIGALVNPLSPLGYSRESIETLIAYAERNQILLLAPCIMAGVSGPINLLGTSVLQNTEALAGIVLSQLVRPGAPVVYGTASNVGNMKDASFAAGSPEAMLINLPNIRLAKEYYHLPTRTMCGITHAKVVDCQAGYETMMSAMMGVLSGANIGVQCIGTLEALLTVSYEKIMIDQEILSRVLRIQSGIDVSKKVILDEDIRQVGPGGNYLLHPGTMAECRSLWFPTVSDWKSYDAWQDAGETDALYYARQLYQLVLQHAPETLLDAETEKTLQRYVDRAELGLPGASLN